jgi:lipopolysaccharide/colanic/teichoic acid biosynthesis glycosyltransferase
MSETISLRPGLNVDHSRSFAFFPSEMLKRAFDLLAASFGMLLFSPLFLYLAWRIKRDSPGPVFYRGERLGRDGKLFHILKFRTMYERPESYQGLRVTGQGDVRITPFGKFLRDSKLNELPQLWNVLTGEMSLVGPRPEDPQVAAAWPADVRQEVLSMRPGLTSPASILYRDEEALLAGEQVMDTYLGEILPSKLRLDQLYVRHHSFGGDLDVLFWTSLVLLPRAGKYTPLEGELFLGPFNLLLRRHASWFVVDALVSLLAMGLAGLLFRAISPLNVGWAPAIALALGFAMLYSLVNYFMGVNRVVWSQASANDVFDLLPGALISTSIALLVNYIWPTGLLGILSTGAQTPWGTEALLPTSMLIMAAGLAFTGFVLVRYRSRLLTGLATRWLSWRGSASTALERVLIIGGGETGQFAAWMLNNNRVYAGAFHIVGFVDDDLFKQGIRLHGVNVLGQRADIPQLVDKHDVGVLVFAIHNISAGERQQVLDICSATSAHVVLFPDIPAALNGLAQNAAGLNTAAQNGYKSSVPDTSVAGERDALPGAPLQSLPCDLCLTKVSPLKVDNWLSQMEAAACTGDFDGLIAQIRSRRSQLRRDATVQRAANLGARLDSFSDTEEEAE